MMPTPAPEAEILGDLLASRLQAVLDPAATVGQINSALVAQDVGIISMLAEHPFVTLAMPPVASEAEAEALAAALKASGAFDHVSPAFEFVPEAVEAPTEAVSADRVPPPTGLAAISHLTALRLPAAWNARALVPAGALPMTVVVPDSYLPFSTHNEIECLQPVGGAFDNRESGGKWLGNHGFHVAGIIGADFDGGPPTGTNPDPRNLLEILAFSRRGYTPLEYIRQLYHESFPWGSPFVVSLSLSYTASHIRGERLDMAYDALELRRLLGDVQDQFLFVTAGGNKGRNADDSGDSRFNYPPTLAHTFTDLREVFAGTGVSPQDSMNFVDHMELTYIEKPEAASRLANVLIVGSSLEDGTERPTSGRNTHLRAVGERVLSTCARSDPGSIGNPDFCDGDVARKSGTSMATPAVAGLAAYLWNLDPALSVSRVRQILLHAYNESNTPGLVDAYIAALSLDTWPEAPVRRTLLDVAGDTPVEGSNGRFDENDIELFIDEWNAADPSDKEWSRYDLNGDGHTGDFGILEELTRFDLSMDWPPDFRADLATMIGNQVVHFDERAVSDCDVLRYYAYTTMYEGDEASRQTLLVPCAGIDLSRYGRLLVTVDIQGVFEDNLGARTEEPFTIHIWGDGSIAGGVIDYAANGTTVNPLTVVDYDQLITGLIEPEGGRISQLEAGIESVTSMWGNWSRTDSAAVGIQNLPLDSQNQSSLWYRVTGPESCASIVYVSAGSAWTTGGRTLVDYYCQPSSQVWVQLVDMPEPSAGGE
jgi:hypothetical protein